MTDGLHILPVALYEQYSRSMDAAVATAFEALQDSVLSAGGFSFYTSVSAVFSSKIEGEDIELDSFIKHRKLGAKIQPDHTRKTDDLYDAYQFAKGNTISDNHVSEAHAMITKHILQDSVRGKARKSNMFVISGDGKIEYVAASPDILFTELQKLYADIATLLQADLSFKEVLFFASMIHLVFVKIHPFEDGNGRTARLLEKWFVASKAGGKAWFVQSERYYYEQHQTYYNNIRSMGLEYDTLDYSKALPFLLMLPGSITHEYK